MCGLVGYVGEGLAVQTCFDMLQKLEYRGYDSAGICFENKGRQKIKKCEGFLEALKQKLDLSAVSNCAIGHTRWATHGKANEQNAHPQVSQNGCIKVVHNGIIENFETLKKELYGFSFSSQTDTEVVAMLLQKHIESNTKQGILKAFSAVCKKLKGSFALAVMVEGLNDCVFFAKKSSPLVIGLGNNFNLLASDSLAISNYTNKVVFLKDCEMGFIEKNNLAVFNFNLVKKKYEPTTISANCFQTQKGNFSSFMEKEIWQASKTIENTLSYLKADEKLKKVLDSKLNNLKNIHIVACGTALHAGMVFKYLLERDCRLSVFLDCASEFRYKNPILDKNSLCFFVSQSGETADTLASLKLAKSQKAFCVAITNSFQSSITRMANISVYTKAGQEIAVASTKAFFGQLSAICFLHTLVCKHFNIKPSFSVDELNKISKKLEEFSVEKDLQSLVPILCQKQSLFFVGRGLDFLLSLEGALKLKEITYIHCEAFAGGELKHGSLSLLDENSVVIVLITQKKLKQKMLSNLNEIKSRGAKVLLISQFVDLKNNANFFLKLPKTKDVLMPFYVTKALQQMAFFCAKHKKINPDKPRNLAKSVTVE